MVTDLPGQGRPGVGGFDRRTEVVGECEDRAEVDVGPEGGLGEVVFQSNFESHAQQRLGLDGVRM